MSDGGMFFRKLFVHQSLGDLEKCQSAHLEQLVSSLSEHSRPSVLGKNGSGGGEEGIAANSVPLFSIGKEVVSLVGWWGQ